jgi:hypothetical protein
MANPQPVITAPVPDDTRAALVSQSQMHGSGIYQITFMPSGDTYVGQAGSLTARWGNHCMNLGHHSGLPRIMQLVAKTEIEEVRFKVLRRCPKKELDYWESYYVLKIQPTLNTDGVSAAMLRRLHADHPDLAGVTYDCGTFPIDPKIEASIAEFKAKRDAENRAKVEARRMATMTPEQVAEFVAAAKERSADQVQMEIRLLRAVGLGANADLLESGLKND